MYFKGIQNSQGYSVEEQISISFHVFWKYGRPLPYDSVTLLETVPTFLELQN
jgi:hypothetical protein